MPHRRQQLALAGEGASHLIGHRIKGLRSAANVIGTDLGNARGKLPTAHDGRCIGWIRRYNEGAHELFGVYTYGCDQQGLRVWVASERSLTGAAAYMAAHVTDLLERSRLLGPDPVNPLGLHERR